VYCSSTRTHDRVVRGADLLVRSSPRCVCSQCTCTTRSALRRQTSQPTLRYAARPGPSPHLHTLFFTHVHMAVTKLAQAGFETWTVAYATPTGPGRCRLFACVAIAPSLRPVAVPLLPSPSSTCVFTPIFTRSQALPLPLPAACPQEWTAWPPATTQSAQAPLHTRARLGAAPGAAQGAR
jgi:hypothetical protein